MHLKRAYRLKKYNGPAEHIEAIHLSRKQRYQIAFFLYIVYERIFNLINGLNVVPAYGTLLGNYDFKFT